MRLGGRGSKVSQISQATRVSPRTRMRVSAESKVGSEPEGKQGTDSVGEEGKAQGLRAPSQQRSARSSATTAGTGDSGFSSDCGSSTQGDEGRRSRSPARRRRRRRKGVAMKSAVRPDLKLDLRRIASGKDGDGTASGAPTAAGGGGSARKTYRPAPLSARTPGTHARWNHGSPRRPAPRLGDYRSGGVLSSLAPHSRPSDKRRPQRRADKPDDAWGSVPQPDSGSNPPAEGKVEALGNSGEERRPSAHRRDDNHGAGSGQGDGVAAQTPKGPTPLAVRSAARASVPASQTSVRPLRVLGNAKNSPRSVLRTLASKNAGVPVAVSAGPRLTASGRVARGAPVVARPDAATVGAVNGRQQQKAKKVANLTPLRLDFDNPSVRPSPLSAHYRPRHTHGLPDSGPLSALPPLRQGVPRTVRSPTDDQGDLLSQRRHRGMVVGGDSAGEASGRVMLSARRGSAPRLAPLGAAGPAGVNSPSASWWACGGCCVALTLVLLLWLSVLVLWFRRRHTVRQFQQLL